jgi:methylase of polypeptide subunit release factors
MYMYPCDEVSNLRTHLPYGAETQCAILTQSIVQPEKDRMDIYHKLFMVARRDRLHTAPMPLDQPRILDLGCGTGIWAIDMAE